MASWVWILIAIAAVVVVALIVMAVGAADRLVYRVMHVRGYPVGDFDAQADLVSVDHPEVVENYRFAVRCSTNCCEQMTMRRASP